MSSARGNFLSISLIILFGTFLPHAGFAQAGNPAQCSACIKKCNSLSSDSEAENCLSACLLKPICRETNSQQNAVLTCTDATCSSSEVE